MGRQRLRFERVARLERLFGLPVHLEDEVALDDITAVDPWMSMTARAGARRDLHERSHASDDSHFVSGQNLNCDGGRLFI